MPRSVDQSVMANDTNEKAPKGSGTVFRLTSKGKLTVIHAFAFTDGFEPKATLLRILRTLTDGEFVHTMIADFAPDTIVHYAEQRSAPYSMIDQQHAVIAEPFARGSKMLRVRPCVAAPGYPMYYLNVLAGPGRCRAM